MNAPLSRYLARFSSEPAADALVLVAVPAPEPTVTLTVGEFDARLEAARQGAHAEIETARAAALAEMEARHAAALAAAVEAARAERTEAEAEALAARVDGAFSALHEQLAEAIAKVLRPVVADALRERAVDALTAALVRLADDPARPTITLRAPARVIAALQMRGVPAGIALAVADVGEAQATLDGTRIETRLAAALADLEEA